MVNAYRTWRSANEQDIVTKTHKTLVNAVGWYRTFVLDDTSSNKHYVFLSEGESSDGRAVRIIALEGTGGYTYFDVLYEGSYDFSTGSYGSLFVGSSTDSRFPYGTSYDSSRCRVIANKDRIIIVAEDSATVRASVYCGFINSLYAPDVDPTPAFIRGQKVDSADWTSQLYLRALRADGTEVAHSLLFNASLISEGSPNPRTGELSFYNPLLYYSGAVGQYEVRGRLDGVYYATPGRVANGSFVSISGDYYFAHKTGDEEDCILFGPVTDDGTVPQDIVQLGFPEEPYLKVDYEKRGLQYETAVSGTLALWRFDTGHLDGYVYGSGDALPVPSQYPDVSGAYNLTPQNGLVSVESRLREAAEFDGSSKYATSNGDSTSASILNGEWTLEFVFMPTAIPTGSSESVLLSYGVSGSTEVNNTLIDISLVAASGTTPDAYQVERGNVKVSWEYSSGVSVVNATSGDFIQQDRWNYMALVKRANGSDYDLEIWHCSFGDHLTPAQRYVVTGITGSSGGSNSNWTVGADYVPSRYYSGQLDDTRVTMRALTPAEIDASCKRSML